MREESTTELLSAFLDGELDDVEIRRVERMLEERPDTRLELEGMRRIVGDLRHLERLAPPPTLGQEVARRIALDGERTSLLDRVEDGLGRLNQQSSTFATFAVVLALAAIVYLFSLALESSRQGLVPVTFDTPAATDSGPLDAHLVLVAGRLFERQHDADTTWWIEQDLDPTRPFRQIELATDDGQALLARHPELHNVARLGRVRLLVSGEILELVPPPSP
ncbi:MAG: hypothetical protein AAGN46_16840 [Acidobacteriota bacterium]